MLIMNLQNLQQENGMLLCDQSSTDYGEENEDSKTVKFETKVITSNLCDYYDHIFLQQET